jgi:hypothetical protein
VSTALRIVARLVPPGPPHKVAPRMSRVLGGYRGHLLDWPLGGRPGAGTGHPRPQSPTITRGGLVGVVWGEGEGAANQRGPAVGVDIPNWIERLVRAVWRRLFVHGGEA